jgi:aspartate kinase
MSNTTVDAASDDRLVVWKFGGTSLGDAIRLRSVAAQLVAARRAGRQVVAVLSAMGDATDQLVRLAHEHSRRPPYRELDSLLAVGECVSCSLVAIAVNELGERAVSLTGGQAGVLTDSSHGRAQLLEMRPQRILDALDDEMIVLVAGFQGESARGDVTTLGRGGSDTSAVAIAAALRTRRCAIFTDVSGVFTADPRVVPSARLLSSLGYEEMLEFAHAGAGVLHARCVELAAMYAVEIHVNSTFAPGHGTWIRMEDAMFEQPRIIGVTHRRHACVIAVRGLTTATASSVLAQCGVRLDTLMRNDDELRLIAPSEVHVRLVAALRDAGARVTVREGLGEVTVVGVGIGARPEIATHALSALASSGVDPELVVSTASRISCQVPSTLVDRATRVLHEAFGLHTAARDLATA